MRQCVNLQARKPKNILKTYVFELAESLNVAIMQIKQCACSVPHACKRHSAIGVAVNARMGARLFQWLRRPILLETQTGILLSARYIVVLA
jgi:hypothetical protein